MSAEERPGPGASAQRRYLSPAQVCEVVPGLTERRLEYLRGKGQGPRYSKPTPKTVIYVLADVEAWVAASMRSTRDQS